MGAVELRLVNEAAWRAALDGIAHDLGDLREPMTAAGDALVASSRSGAPHRTGAMAAAHAGLYASANRYRLTVNHPGAAPVHWGWPAHNIRRQPWVVARFWHDATVLDRFSAGLQAGLDSRAEKVR